MLIPLDQSVPGITDRPGHHRGAGTPGPNPLGTRRAGGRAASSRLEPLPSFSHRLPLAIPRPGRPLPRVNGSRRTACRSSRLVISAGEGDHLLSSPVTPGRSGWLPTQTPHRSVLAPFAHTAPRFKPSLRDGTPSGRRPPAGADSAPAVDTSAPRRLDRRDGAGPAISSRARSHVAGIGSTHPRCP